MSCYQTLMPWLGSHEGSGRPFPAGPHHPLWPPGVRPRLTGGEEPFRLLDLGPHSALEHEGVHPEVPPQGPEGILESRRPVPLDEEMADPGEPVAEDRREEQDVGGDEDAPQEAEEDAGRPDEVAEAVRRVVVLGDVEGPEGFEAPKALGHLVGPPWR